MKAGKQAGGLAGIQTVRQAESQRDINTDKSGHQTGTS